MGNSYSGPKPLKTFFSYGENFTVKLESPKYQEGELGSGKVCFDLNQQVPPFVIRLNLLAYEVVFWEYKVYYDVKVNGKRETRSRIETAKGHK